MEKSAGGNTTDHGDTAHHTGQLDNRAAADSADNCGLHSLQSSPWSKPGMD